MFTLNDCVFPARGTAIETCTEAGFVPSSDSDGLLNVQVAFEDAMHVHFSTR